MRRAGLTAAGLTVVALCGVGYATAASAASSCARTMTITPKGLGIALSPSTAKVKVGDCVAIHNATKSSASVSTKLHGPATIAAGATDPYKATSVGTDGVKVTSKPLGLPLATATGTVTVSAAPSPSPTASSSPSPGAGHTTSPSTHPDVAPSPKRSKGANNGSKGSKGSASPAPHATGIALPPLPPLPSSGVTAVPLGSNPLVAPGPTSPAATSTSTVAPAPSAAVVADRLEPVNNDQRGLPEAVGVCVVLGLATGWGRVLLASPDDAVDDDPYGDHRL